MENTDMFAENGDMIPNLIKYLIYIYGLVF